MFLPLKDETPTRRRPVVTLGLLAANLAAFAWQMGGAAGPARVAIDLGFVPSAFGSGSEVPWATLLTSMFLHGGLAHLGGNLLFLWIFGNNVEDLLGPGRFLLFYLAAGLGGHLAHWASAPGSTIPTVGASGAISGILPDRFSATIHKIGNFGFLILFGLMFTGILRYLLIPAHMITVFFVRLVRVPAIVLIGLWLLQQVVYGAGSLGATDAGGGVAWFEHLGGFAVGAGAFLALGGRPGSAWASRRRGAWR